MDLAENIGLIEAGVEDDSKQGAAPDVARRQQSISIQIGTTNMTQDTSIKDNLDKTPRTPENILVLSTMAKALQRTAEKHGDSEMLKNAQLIFDWADKSET